MQKQQTWGIHKIVPIKLKNYILYWYLKKYFVEAGNRPSLNLLIIDFIIIRLCCNNTKYLKCILSSKNKQNLIKNHLLRKVFFLTVSDLPIKYYLKNNSRHTS